MPARRSARAKQLIKLYLLHRQLRKQRLRRRLAFAKQHTLQPHCGQREKAVISELLPKLLPLSKINLDDSSSDDSTSSSSAGWLTDASSDGSHAENGNKGDLSDDADDEQSSQSDSMEEGDEDGE